jgi:uncharacterized surface protein with fasciclin (FAS1) repeats
MHPTRLRLTLASAALAIPLAALVGCAPSQAAGTAQPMGSTSMASMDAANPMVGGQAMLPSRNIVENALNSPDHTTLVAAVKAAGLVKALEGAGPFTVFAPTNEAFNALPPGTVPTLLKPENKKQLTAVLTYHVVPGRLDMATLEKLITAGGGKATLKTLNGESLTAMMNGPHNIVIADAKGGVADISTYDVYQSNGVIQVIDRVLLP